MKNMPFFTGSPLGVNKCQLSSHLHHHLVWWHQGLEVQQDMLQCPALWQHLCSWWQNHQKLLNGSRSANVKDYGLIALLLWRETAQPCPGKEDRASSSGCKGFCYSHGNSFCWAATTHWYFWEYHSTEPLQLMSRNCLWFQSSCWWIAQQLVTLGGLCLLFSTAILLGRKIKILSSR